MDWCTLSLLCLAVWGCCVSASGYSGYVYSAIYIWLKWLKDYILPVCMSYCLSHKRGIIWHPDRQYILTYRFKNQIIVLLYCKAFFRQNIIRIHRVSFISLILFRSTNSPLSTLRITCMTSVNYLRNITTI
jgi:hypothetical protein